MRIRFGAILSLLIRKRMNENMVWTDSQDYSADEILSNISTKKAAYRRLSSLISHYPYLIAQLTKLSARDIAG